MRELIVTSLEANGRPCICAAVFDEKVLTRLQVEPAGTPSLVGHIYAATVEQCAPQIGSAFLRAGKKLRLFLPLKHGSRLHTGQRLLVQVTRDADGEKEAVCTKNLHLAGELAVVSRNPGPVAVSKKLDDAARDTLRAAAEEAGEKTFGITVRTKAAKASADALTTEIKSLSAQLTAILAKGEQADGGTLLYAPDAFYQTLRRDLIPAPDMVLTDLPEAAAVLTPSEEQSCDVRYEDRSLPLAERYGLPEQVTRLLAARVSLPGGAFLYVEQTKAFAAIDVNSGAVMRGADREETFRQINLQAAEEAMRQIRLRNLSGTILIDFINLSDEAHRKELLRTVRELAAQDFVRCEAVDLTPLGILEIVRHRTFPPLAETLTP